MIYCSLSFIWCCHSLPNCWNHEPILQNHTWIFFFPPLERFVQLIRFTGYRSLIASTLWNTLRPSGFLTKGCGSRALDFILAASLSSNRPSCSRPLQFYLLPWAQRAAFPFTPANLAFLVSIHSHSPLVSNWPVLLWIHLFLVITCLMQLIVTTHAAGTPLSSLLLESWNPLSLTSLPRQ